MKISSAYHWNIYYTGDAHGEHFENDEQKFREKWKLFATCQSMVIEPKII